MGLVNKIEVVTMKSEYCKVEHHDMVIRLEQYIAINNEVWIKDVFEQFKE